MDGGQRGEDRVLMDLRSWREITHNSGATYSNL